MTTAKVLAFSGSSRTNSYNKKLIKITAEGARAAGADVIVINKLNPPFSI